MSSDILETLINKLKTCGYFSLQIDETTDITIVKVLPTELSETMNDCIRVANFI